MNGHRNIARAICVDILDRGLKSWGDHLDFVSRRRYFIPSQVALGCGSLFVELSRHSGQRQCCCVFHTRVRWSLDVNVETDGGTDFARRGRLSWGHDARPKIRSRLLPQDRFAQKDATEEKLNEKEIGQDAH